MEESKSNEWLSEMVGSSDPKKGSLERIDIIIPAPIQDFLCRVEYAQLFEMVWRKEQKLP